MEKSTDIYQAKLLRIIVVYTRSNCNLLLPCIHYRSLMRAPSRQISVAPLLPHLGSCAVSFVDTHVPLVNDKSPKSPCTPFSSSKAAEALLPMFEGEKQQQRLGPPNCISPSSPGEDPHEEQLHNICVEEEELRPLVALCTGVGLHRAAGTSRGLGEEDVLQGS